MLPKIRILIFIVVLIAFSACIYISFPKITIGFMKELNRAMLKEEISTVKTAFSRRTETISRINRDWAQWDDTYLFVQDLNKKFVEENLLDEAFDSANINMFIFFNRDGDIVYNKARSLGGRGDTSIPAEVFNYTTNNNRINIKEIINTGEQQTGFLGTTYGTFIFAVSPIVTSEGKGPAMGALMMARYFNEIDLAALKQYTGLELDFVEHTQIGNWRHPDVTHKEVENGDVVLEKDNVFSAYTLVKDSWGNDAIVINLQHKLIGIEYAKRITLALSALSIGAMALFGIVILSTLGGKNICKICKLEERVSRGKV